MELIQHHLREGTYDSPNFRLSKNNDGYWKAFLRFQMDLRLLYGVRPKCGIYCACGNNIRSDFMIVFDTRTINVCCFPRLTVQLIGAKHYTDLWPKVIYRDHLSSDLDTIPMIALFFEEIHKNYLDARLLKIHILEKMASIDNDIATNISDYCN